MDRLDKILASDLVPESILRLAIRKICKERLDEQSQGTLDQVNQRLEGFIEEMNRSPLALVPEKANEQHYEVPAEFYDLVLGKHKKYSSCLFASDSTPLDQAEADMLRLTCTRAELVDGMDILELGCGWGSLTLWMAQNYPKSSIIAVSNSASQKIYIESQLAARNLQNVTIVTADMNDFAIAKRFDRIVSVEMFEHMRNYGLLFTRMAAWLKNEGKLFFHIFCHHRYHYPYLTEGSSNWMGRYFFSGGMMPSENLPLRFQKGLVIENLWRVNGMHYSLTADAWTNNMNANKKKLLPILREIYGAGNEKLWFVRWKLFFLACSELFGYAKGTEWYVTHYLFSKRVNSNRHSDGAGEY